MAPGKKNRVFVIGVGMTKVTYFIFSSLSHCCSVKQRETALCSGEASMIT